MNLLIFSSRTSLEMNLLIFSSRTSFSVKAILSVSTPSPKKILNERVPTAA